MRARACVRLPRMCQSNSTTDKVVLRFVDGHKTHLPQVDCRLSEWRTTNMSGAAPRICYYLWLPAETRTFQNCEFAYRAVTLVSTSLRLQSWGRMREHRGSIRISPDLRVIRCMGLYDFVWISFWGFIGWSHLTDRAWTLRACMCVCGVLFFF